MPKSRIPSPARSQSALVTPRRAKPRGPRSVGSPARSNTSVRLTSVIQNFKDKNMDSFHLSPLNSRRSVLNDNTDIEEPKRSSWWKKLNDTSRDIMEVLETDKQEEPYNVIEEYMDVEVLSQERQKNPTLDLPDSSDNESISSIIVPQRKLFSQKENQPQPQKKFAEFLGTRESMAKLNKTSGASDKSEKTIVAGTKKLFGQASKPRSKPAFPTELLRFSPDKTVNKTAGEIKGQVRNLFGNRAGVKRKNNFADFIASESEEEPEIQPKVFGFQKKSDVPSRRVSTASRGNRDHSPTSSVTTDIDMDDWKLLPSSTMVQTQLEAMITDSPAKKARLSKLSEGKESEAATNSTAVTNKTKQSNKSITSKNKSKMSVSFVNKSKTSPKQNNDENIRKTVVNEEVLEQVDQEGENDENEVSLHYSDDEPQEDNLEEKHDNNETKQSNQSVTSKNKSKTSMTRSSMNKSTSVAQKSIRREAIAEENENAELITNKSKKNDSKLSNELDRVQEEENPTGENTSQQIDAENQEVEDELKHASHEMEEENQESDEENESQEVENENQDTETEQEDEEENESQEIEDKNQNSEVEQEDEQEKDESEIEQEMEDRNQDTDVDQENEQVTENEKTLDKIREITADNDEHNGTNQDKKNMEVDNELAVNKTSDKTKLSNQSVTSVNKSKKSLLLNKSKTSPKSNVSQHLKKTLTAEEKQGDQEVELANEENVIFNQDDEDAQEMDNLQHNDKDVTNKSKHSNESMTSKNKSKLSITKYNMNKTNVSLNKSGTSITKMSTSKSFINKSKSLPNYKNVNAHEFVADEGQVVAEEGMISNSQDINNGQLVNKSIENENETEQEQSPEILNESQEIEVQNHLSEENESQDVENESEEVENEDENEEEEENDEEDGQNESEVEVENQGQDVEDESQRVENESQEIDNDEENEEAEESEMEVENESQEVEDENQESEIEQEYEQEIDEDEPQESEEAMEESDEQNDAENDNQESQEEISGIEEGTPNATHDTTGRNRKKNETNVKSPEAILHDNTNQMESFTAKGRNTSIRRTSMMKSLNIRPSMAPPRDSTGFSDGTKNSSTEGSGWDSHRITKKTLRQTFGRDFTPRKSLRALVMEKSAKRHTEFNVNDVDVPRANSTELPEDTRYEMEVDAHDVSKRTRQTTLEMYLQKIKKQNMEKRKKLEEEVRNSLKAPARESSNPFTVPSRLFALKRLKPGQNKPKTKAVKTMIPLDDLPQELIEDMKYKPPKRFQPSNASWITKRLYKFLEGKLEAKYDYKARIRAEKLVETLYNFTKDLRRHNVAPTDAVEVLKHEMARLDVVRTHFDFYQFFHDYMPREVRVKVNPDVVNKIPMPRQGVFSDILRGNTVQG